MPFFLIRERATVPAPALSEVHSDHFDSAASAVSAITYSPVGHQAGDMVFAIIHNDGDDGIASTPSGAVLLTSELDNDAAHARAYQLTLSGSEGTLTWILASANQAKADFLTVRNVDLTVPVPEGGIVELSQLSANSSITLPAATVLRDGSWFFHSMSNDQDGAMIALSSWPAEISQSSPDERRREDVGEPFSLSQYSALETDLEAGSTGTRTYTLVSNDSMQVIGVVIQPAGPSSGSNPSPSSQIIDIAGALVRIESGITGNNVNA